MSVLDPRRVLPASVAALGSFAFAGLLTGAGHGPYAPMAVTWIPFGAILVLAGLARVNGLAIRRALVAMLPVAVGLSLVAFLRALHAEGDSYFVKALRQLPLVVGAWAACWSFWWLLVARLVWSTFRSRAENEHAV